MNTRTTIKTCFIYSIMMLTVCICTQMSYASKGKEATVSVTHDMISINADNSSLADILTAIQNESGIKIVFEKNLTDKISIELSNMPFEDGLKRLLKQYDYAMIWELRNDEPVLIAVRIIGKEGEKGKQESESPSSESNTLNKAISDRNGLSEENEIKEKPETFNKISLISDLSESTVNVAIENAKDMGAYEFRFTYDPKTIQIENITSDAFLSNTGRNVSFLGPKIDNQKGEALFGAFSFGDNKGAEGGGILAKVKYSGESSSIPIKLNKVKLLDKNGEKLN